MSHSAERPDGEGGMQPQFAQALPLTRLASMWPTGQTPWQNVWLAAVAHPQPLWLPPTDEPALAAMLMGYARHHHADLPDVPLAELPPAVREALASEWSRGLFSRLLIPQLSLLLMQAHLLPLAGAALRVAADGEVLGFGLPHGGTALGAAWPTAPDEADALTASLIWLLEQALWPWIRALVRVTGCRASVLWCNAACYWRWWLESEPLLARLAELPADEAQSAQSRRQRALLFITQGELPSVDCYGAHELRQLARNPLYQPLRLRQVGGQAVMVRRVCCQRYRLPQLALCPSCPVVQAPPRRSGASS